MKLRLALLSVSMFVLFLIHELVQELVTKTPGWRFGLFMTFVEIGSVRHAESALLSNPFAHSFLQTFMFSSVLSIPFCLSTFEAYSFLLPLPLSLAKRPLLNICGPFWMPLGSCPGSSALSISCMITMLDNLLCAPS
jgi:hypothetical protein